MLEKTSIFCESTTLTTSDAISVADILTKLAPETKHVKQLVIEAGESNGAEIRIGDSDVVAATGPGKKIEPGEDYVVVGCYIPSLYVAGASDDVVHFFGVI